MLLPRENNVSMNAVSESLLGYLIFHCLSYVYYFSKRRIYYCGQYVCIDLVTGQILISLCYAESLPKYGKMNEILCCLLQHLIKQKVVCASFSLL